VRRVTCDAALWRSTSEHSPVAVVHCAECALLILFKVQGFSCGACQPPARPRPAAVTRDTPQALEHKHNGARVSHVGFSSSVQRLCISGYKQQTSPRQHSLLQLPHPRPSQRPAASGAYTCIHA
jgi:hypothetical protein